MIIASVAAVRPVVLSCDQNNVNEETDRIRGEQGVPGKRGARGPPGCS